MSMEKPCRGAQNAVEGPELSAECGGCAISRFAGSFSFWEQLTPGQRKRLCRASRFVSCAKGTAVHAPTEECLGVLLLKSGQLRTYLLSEDGRDITLYRLFAGDTCILSASCVLDAVTFDCYIDAEEDTEALLIPAFVFRALMEENIHVKAFAYELATIRFSDVMWAMQQLLFMSADKRLAIFLSDELAKTGGDTLCMTHEQIAKYMGSAREVVSRLLKYFVQEGIVKLSRGGVTVLDKEKLHLLARQA